MTNDILAKQTLFIAVGIPGSGKSYLARQLADSMKLMRISEDRIRLELFETPQYSKDENAIVNNLLMYFLDETLQSGQSVIIDGEFGLRKTRRKFHELATASGAASILIWTQTDVETAYRRATNRDKRRPDDRYTPELNEADFDKFVARFKPPTNEKALVVSGKHLFKAQQANILRKLHQLKLLKVTQRPETAAPTRQVVERPEARRNLSRDKQPLRVRPNS